MRWRLEEKHYIDDQVLEPGTLVGDDTDHPYVFTKDDKKLNRKVGEPMPPSRAMTPMDEEARAVYRKTFDDEIPERDPLKAIPLTGAQGSPTIKPAQTKQPENPPKQGLATQKEPEQPKTGVLAPKPAGHDSSKNPGDSKDTETAKAPDIKKL